MTPTAMRDRARELRQRATVFEQELWQQLRSGPLSGFKFRRQKVIGPYIVDFICPATRLIIELDGSQHATHQPYDQARDAWLHAQGYQVLRIWNSDWSQHRQDVLTLIWNRLHDPQQPSPQPLSHGVGEGL
jgi:very-short-patch-repair endonuclease